jgi:hypothetical protein
LFNLFSRFPPQVALSPNTCQINLNYQVETRLWDQMSSNCRLAMAKYQCGILYPPCNTTGGKETTPNLPLLPPANLCNSIALSCSRFTLFLHCDSSHAACFCVCSLSDQVAVSLTLSASSTPKQLFSPVCAAANSTADSVAFFYLNFHSSPSYII